MARRAATKEQESTPAASGNDLAASVARLAEATTLLLRVAERLDRRTGDPAPPDAPPSDPARPRKPRRKKAEPPPETPTETETAQAVQAALGGVIDTERGGDTARVQMNTPSDKVFERFFGKVLELYEVNLKRQAEERDRRFRSGDREEAVQEIQATIEAVFFSPLITNAEKNATLHILIKQIIPYEDRIEITYW